MPKVKPIPDGYPVLTPYLVVEGAAKAIDFYKSVFGAVERMRMEGGGKIGHAEVTINGSLLMLADVSSEMPNKDPRALGGSPVTMLLYVENVDEVVATALAAGATLLRPIADQFYGDRTGGIEDPFGHNWYIATHIEDVSPEDMQKRAAALQASA